jgi:hypothetical protein
MLAMKEVIDNWPGDRELILKSDYVCDYVIQINRCNYWLNVLKAIPSMWDVAWNWRHYGWKLEKIFIDTQEYVKEQMYGSQTSEAEHSG